MLVDQNVVLAEMKREVASIRTSMDQATGSWKMLVWLGGVTATMSAAVTWGVQHFLK
jgi:negative regulator of sigma E activity